MKEVWQVLEEEMNRLSPSRHLRTPESLTALHHTVLLSLSLLHPLALGQAMVVQAPAKGQRGVKVPGSPCVASLSYASKCFICS